MNESSGPLLANASQPIRTGYESDPACLLGCFVKYLHACTQLYMVTAVNRLQLFICLCPKPVGVIRHSLLHVRCVSCLCPRTVSISWYCMFHNGCISCCVFGHFTAAPRHGIGAGRSGKNQFICRLETGLHFFLGNTNV